MQIALRAVLGLGLLATLSNACGGQSAADAEQQRALSTAKNERQELLTKFRAATPAVVSKCEVSDGDCMILVGEKREALFKPQPSCEAQTDVYEREGCMANLLAKDGKLHEVTEFFQYENWCLQKMVECGADEQKQAEQNEHLALVESRRQTLVKNTDVSQLAFDIAHARERVNYLRATVPGDKDAVCSALPEVKACRERARAAGQKLDAELDKEQAAYNPALASEFFRSEMTEQAGCFQPEYECLFEHVSSVGENRESKRHLERNLKLIKEREELVQRLPADRAQECLTAAETDYGKGVSKAYGRYAKKSNTLYRILLHQAYVKLHTAEVKCLKHQAK